MILMQICKASSDAEAIALEARLTELQVEHCCLCNLMLTSNARLIGPWNQQWTPPMELADDIQHIMVKTSPTAALFPALSFCCQVLAMPRAASALTWTGKSKHMCLH